MHKKSESLVKKKCATPSINSYTHAHVYENAETTYTSCTLNEVTNGYRLNVSGSSSGTGTISETTGISSVSAAADDDNAPRYAFDGRRVTSTTKGIIIQDGKKFIHR